jgi:hypothetical protein
MKSRSTEYRILRGKVNHEDRSDLRHDPRSAVVQGRSDTRPNLLLALCIRVHARVPNILACPIISQPSDANAHANVQDVADAGDAPYPELVSIDFRTYRSSQSNPVLAIAKHLLLHRRGRSSALRFG